MRCDHLLEVASLRGLNEYYYDKTNGTSRQANASPPNGGGAPNEAPSSL